MRALQFLPLGLVIVALAGCQLIVGVQPPPDPIVQMEVWNRTLDDIALVDADGRIINVPACGHAGPAPLASENVEVRMDAGQISTFGSGGVPSPQYLIVVAEGGASFPTNVHPFNLPPCAGHPAVAP